MQWVVLDARASIDSAEKQVEVPVVDPELEELSADALAPLSALPEVLVDNSDLHLPQDAADDSSNRSVLYGRYVGQINARIFRAWLRPRTPIGLPAFKCRARIAQDVLGNVGEVMLEDCNGDARWQLSVVHAIQSASPLPAPPDPRVFRHEITVSFQSEGYHDGPDTDGFEPSDAQIADSAIATRNNNEFSVTRTSDP
jgi:TonB C terminal